MNHRPPGYQPPPILAPYFAAHAMGLDPDTVQFTGFVPPAAPNGLDPAATTSTESLLAPEAGKPDFNLLLSIAAGVSTHNPDELPTRVPPAPVESPTASDGQSNDIAIITDVGLEQAQGGGSAARLEAAYKAAAAAATSRFTTMGPPTMGPPSAKHSQFLHHTARAPVSQDNSFVSQASARRVHWDESLPRAENNEVSGSSFPSLPPLPVAAPAGLLNPLRSMNAAQGTETQPMSYYAQQQHNQLQQETSEQMAEQERRHREESALMGLETYQLECEIDVCILQNIILKVLLLFQSFYLYFHFHSYLCFLLPCRRSAAAGVQRVLQDDFRRGHRGGAGQRGGGGLQQWWRNRGWGWGRGQEPAASLRAAGHAAHEEAADGGTAAGAQATAARPPL